MALGSVSARTWHQYLLGCYAKPCDREGRTIGFITSLNGDKRK